MNLKSIFYKDVIIISCYSGKCDVFDSLVEINKYTDEELKNNVVIYVGNSDEQSKINSQKDLIPYYPYIIGSAYYDNKNRKSVIHLSSESFVDREEKEYLEYELKSILRIYNRCKRKKVEFDVEEAVREMSWNGYNREVHREIANRVKESGKKANTDGINLESCDYYRRNLVKEMIKNGLNPSLYGYSRFVDEEGNIK